MKPFNIVTSKCKRCGKAISTGSVMGIQNKQGLDEICKDCITPEERQQILKIQGEHITKEMK